MGCAARAIKGSWQMRWIDLGVLDAPLLLFGGPYSNLHALEALLRVAQARGISGAQMICTGDVVAYGAAPARTVAAIRAAGCTVIAGNVERQLAAGADGCGCGFAPGSTCDRLSAGWFTHADAAISGADRDWMAQLPDGVTFLHHGSRYAVIHGGAGDVARFVWPGCDEEVFAQEIALITDAAGPIDAVVAGHCGVPFIRDVAGARWINAGVIGMPPHDGRPATRYALLDGGQASLHALEYDHVAAQAAMTRAGLTQGYDAALVSGYWPSEDVLPPDLRVAADLRKAADLRVAVSDRG